MGVKKGVILPEIRSCAEVYGNVKPTQENQLPSMFANVPISGVSTFTLFFSFNSVLEINKAHASVNDASK
jgi:hypothetical protein